MGTAPLRGGTVVVAEKATDALASANGTTDTLPWRTIDELVAQPLVVSFTVFDMDGCARARRPEITIWMRVRRVIASGGASLVAMVEATDGTAS